MNLAGTGLGALLWCCLGLALGAAAARLWSSRRFDAERQTLQASLARIQQSATADRLRAQEQLAHASQRMEAFIDALPDAILRLGEDACVQHTNPAGQRLFGVERSAAQGMRIDQLVREHAAPTRAASSLLRVEHALLDPWPLNDIESLQATRPDGQPLDVQWWLWRAHHLEQPCVLAVFRDMAAEHRRQAERETLARDLRHLQREHAIALAHQSAVAQAAARAKDEFLANMSHELRTPMNTVMGLAHQARESAQGEQAQRLARLSEAAHHLMALLNDILEFARAESGASALQLRECNMAALVHQVAQLLLEPAARQGLQLVPWIDAATPALVRTDELRLRRVLLNLVSNAIKFTERGHVTLRVRSLSRHGQQSRMLVEVYDTGIGMSPETVQRLGGAFEQGDASSTRGFGGTGLGVAICRRVLQMMGSELQVHSQLGRGSRFAFTLDLAVVPDSGPADQDLLPHAGLRVLVVDSLDDARAALADELGALGCQVQAVASLDEALLALGHAESQQRVGGSGFEICVLDALTLGHAAQDAAKRIAAATRQSPPRLLWLTAPGQSFSADAPALPGACISCAKPADRQQLTQALQRCSQLQAEAEAANGTGPALGSRSLDAAEGTGASQTARQCAVHGLDREAGLKRVRGNAAHFERLLRRFVQGHLEDPEQLRECAARGDFATAHALAHQLKGSAGTIGAHAVAELAAQVPDQAHGPAAEQAAASVLRLAHALQTLLQALDIELHGYHPQPTDSAAEVQQDNLCELADDMRPALLVTPADLQTLRALLERRDMSARRHLQQHGSSLRQQLGPHAAPLMHAVETFDFDAALTLLDSWQAAAAGSKSAVRPASSEVPA